ncbi:MAG: aldehyde dehydrogenase family protein, partial [Pseudomonadota bacterium]|nr:aldehyde dehydrogenase family protein [Pseudomonadota bacterium]
SFTGSADTALALRGTPNLLRNSVRFAAEQDSLNATILGSDVAVGDPEFDLFVKEVVTEITAKAGQKCTAVRRILVPEPLRGPIAEALSARLADVTLGDPRLKEVGMGALAGAGQQQDVLATCALFADEARCIIGGEAPELTGENLDGGAWFAPTIFDCADPDAATHLHEREAFG